MKEWMDPDEYFMRKALKLAENGRGTTNPNPMVGCVIVKDGRIISEGWHERAGGSHAEIHAIDNACETIENSTMYITLEPCSHHGRTPPCADRIIKEGVKRVVIAAGDPNPQVSGKGIEKLRLAGIEVKPGMLKKQAEIQNEVFRKYITCDTPFVLFKSAISLDGKIATSTGKSQWISCEESRKQVHSLRSEYTGIMAGINTVLLDDPLLTSRVPGGRNPIRIIVDSALNISENARLLSSLDEAPLIIAVTDKSSQKKRRILEDMGAQIILCPQRAGMVHLTFLMKELHKRGIDSILLEGGGTLAFTAFKEELIDKVLLYLAPTIIGGKDARTAVEGDGFSSLDKITRLKDVTTGRCGEDIRIQGYVAKNMEV